MPSNDLSVFCVQRIYPEKIKSWKLSDQKMKQHEEISIRETETQKAAPPHISAPGYSPHELPARDKNNERMNK